MKAVPMCCLMVVVLLGVGCDADTMGDIATLPNTPTNSPKAAPQKVPHTLREELELTKQVYKKAYDQAHKEITNMNARARLEQIDEQVEREKDMMR